MVSNETTSGIEAFFNSYRATFERYDTDASSPIGGAMGMVRH